MRGGAGAGPGLWGRGLAGRGAGPEYAGGGAGRGKRLLRGSRLGADARGPAAPTLVKLTALRHALLHGHRGHRQPVVRWHRRLHLPQPRGLCGLQREAPAGQALLQRL